ncbi:hydrogenase maturation nickel metallochaperone HypA/HybF [Deinococcus roseus]|uniref:Hydrogenase maturation factor HypA n=1 Tax=Deinococcus roseus TaxID=392414 RepID=A0ABQ2DKH1_9DEIO|nr:hydrogenase maturation nickel metallochaperone HypA [Deinococcus roseus]GGJ58373.1 putative hydrogenase nickel incorporation protein HypA [Deinococcus roseus]
MHEASILLALIDQVQDVLQHHPGMRVKTVTVRIGTLSSVIPEALHFAYPAGARGTVLEQATLVIETVEAVGICPEHGDIPLHPQRGLRCPHCDHPITTLRSGEELELEALELEET